MELYLNTATIQPASFERKLAIARQAGYDGVELFADDLDAFGAATDLTRLMDMLGEHCLRTRRLLPPHRLFSWHAMQSRDFRRLKAEFCRLFELALRLGVSAIILPVATGDGTVADTRENFAVACDWAIDFGLQLAYEPVGHTGKTSRVREAWAVVREAGQANGGLFLDVFHFYRAGCGPEDLEGIPTERVQGVHLCDALPLPREELIGTRHRAVPGEGVVGFEALLRLFWEAGYRDYFAVEILNADLWAGDLQVLATRAARACRAALASVSGVGEGMNGTTRAWPRSRFSA